MRRAANALLSAAVLTSLAAVAGCTALPGSESAVAAISKDSRQRKAELVGDFERRRDEANFQGALNRYRAGDREGCQQALASLLSRTPEHRQAGLLWIELQLEQENPAAAQEVAERLAAAYADDSVVQAAAARVATTAAQDDDAELAAVSDDIDRAENPGPEAAAADAAELLAEAEAAILAGDHARAAQRVAQAQDCTPEDPQVTISATVTALRCGQSALAVELSQWGVCRFPDSAALHCALGHAHYRGGNLKAAQVSLQQALSLDNRSGLTYFLMGQTLEKLGQREAAHRHFAKARQLDPRWAAKR